MNREEIVVSAGSGWRGNELFEYWKNLLVCEGIRGIRSPLDGARNEAEALQRKHDAIDLFVKVGSLVVPTRDISDKAMKLPADTVGSIEMARMCVHQGVQIFVEGAGKPKAVRKSVFGNLSSIVLNHDIRYERQPILLGDLRNAAVNRRQRS